MEGLDKTVTLMQGDCVKKMKALSAASVDLVITSPPYDNLRKYTGYAWSFSDTSVELYRVIKPGGVIVWVVGDATVNGSESGSSFRQALGFMDIGFNLHDTMIYEKVNYVPLTHNRYEQAFEYMFVLSKGRPRTFNPLRIPKRTNSRPGRFHQKPGDGVFTAAHSSSSAVPDKIASNIFSYAVGLDKSGHPAAFPEDLARTQVTTWSNAGDTILDPFMGSGTTGKVSVEEGRKFIGIDVSAEYVELARNRIRAANRTTTRKA
jgi:site-specific DNA-methyltransferase (adenine-specific)